MATPAVPAGYAVERERGAVVVALPSVIERVLARIADAGSLYDAAAVRADAQPFSGRGAAYRMVETDGDWLVRHYRRGGAVARVMSDEYVRAGEPRPLRELRASCAARARGVDTPEVLAAVTYPYHVFYRADLATRFIPRSRDLAAIQFGSPGAGERATEAERVAAWRAAGALLRTAFTAGLVHVDLNLRNILIAGDAAPRALLLDLDRARVHARPVGEGARARMLERLHRSRRKLERVAGAVTGERELAAFDAGLAGGDG